MMCAHIVESGYRGVTPTMARLRPCCTWSSMEPAVQEFVQQCMHCADSNGGALASCPLVELRHSAVVVEVLHYDYLHLGDVEGGSVFSERTGLVYVLEMVEDVSGFVWLDPLRSCTAAATARVSIKSCVVFGPPKVRVSNSTTNIRNG